MSARESELNQAVSARQEAEADLNAELRQIEASRAQLEQDLQGELEALAQQLASEQLSHESALAHSAELQRQLTAMEAEKLETAAQMARTRSHSYRSTAAVV